MTLDTKDESKKFLRKYHDNKYLIPLNVINNIKEDVQIKIIPIYYNCLSKKIKNLINNIDIFYKKIVKNNILYNSFKSIHIANLVYKNQQIIKTYNNNKHLTSIHAEHSVIISCCKLNLCRVIGILCVIRYNKNGIKCISKPCNHCLIQIKKNNIKNFIYSVNEDLFHICKII